MNKRQYKKQLKKDIAKQGINLEAIHKLVYTDKAIKIALSKSNLLETHLKLIQPVEHIEFTTILKY
jgi:hypothetical protein